MLVLQHLYAIYCLLVARAWKLLWSHETIKKIILDYKLSQHDGSRLELHYKSLVSGYRYSLSASNTFFCINWSDYWRCHLPSGSPNDARSCLVICLFVFQLRCDTGMGQPVIFRSRVVTGAGAGWQLLHPHKPIPLLTGYGFYGLRFQPYIF